MSVRAQRCQSHYFSTTPHIYSNYFQTYYNYYYYYLICFNIQCSDAFEKFRKVTTSFYMTVFFFFHVEHHGSHWKDIHECYI